MDYQVIGGSFVAVRRISQISAEVVAGSAAWLGKGLQHVCARRRDSNSPLSFELTPAEEALRALPDAAFPEEELHDLVSEQWKEMGWQEKDPSTDLGGGGYISLENLFFARNFPNSFQVLLRNQEGDRASWEYPFALSGDNITSMLIQMLDPEAEEVVTGSDAWLGKGLSHVCAERRDNDSCLSFDLTRAEEVCLQRLQNRIDVLYDTSLPKHQEAFRALRDATFPEEELHDLVCEQWKEMGWQGIDLSTDLSGGGYISLKNLCFARNFMLLLRMQEGDMWEYLYSVSGVDITSMLIQMLDLEAVAVVVGSPAWLGKGQSWVCAQIRDNNSRLSFDLTPAEEVCLQRLQNRIHVLYDTSHLGHQEALRALRDAAFPEEEDLVSEQWKEMGWQGKDLSTDLSGGGYISLENLFFARNFPTSFQVLLRKQEGDMLEYLFAVAGVDITSMLIQMYLKNAEVVVGSAAWLGKGLSCVCAQIRDSDSHLSFDLTPAEEVCLQRLQNHIDVLYDTSLLEHQEALRALWDAAFPEEEFHDLVSEQWKEMGWQEKDPSTDLIGGGYVSSENLLYFAMSFLEVCLQRLQNRIDVMYDTSLPEHQEALRALQDAAFPEEELHDLVSVQWKEMRWRGKDPSTDLSGGGCITLNLYFARNFPKSFLVLLRMQEGDTWEYIFSVAGVDITSMLIQMLDLEAAEVVKIGSATWLGKGLLCVCGQIGDSNSRFSLDLTPAEKVCLQRLHNRIDVTFDTSLLERQEALRALWDAAFPVEELHDLVSEQWKEMGWQEKDPSTDLSGGGYVLSENLLYSAMSFPKSFQVLLQKQAGDGAMWEYPFAVSGVNITSMLIQMLDPEAAEVVVGSAAWLGKGLSCVCAQIRDSNFRLPFDLTPPEMAGSKYIGYATSNGLVGVYNTHTREIRERDLVQFWRSRIEDEHDLTHVSALEFSPNGRFIFAAFGNFLLVLDFRNLLPSGQYYLGDRFDELTDNMLVSFEHNTLCIIDVEGIRFWLIDSEGHLYDLGLDLDNDFRTRRTCIDYDPDSRIFVSGFCRFSDLVEYAELETWDLWGLLNVDTETPIHTETTGLDVVCHIAIHGNSICAALETQELIMSTYHMLTGFAHIVRIPAMEGHVLLGCCFPNRNIWWTDINRHCPVILVYSDIIVLREANTVMYTATVPDHEWVTAYTCDRVGPHIYLGTNSGHIITYTYGLMTFELSLTQVASNGIKCMTNNNIV